jgi:hypothetical protein
VKLESEGAMNARWGTALGLVLALAASTALGQSPDYQGYDLDGPGYGSVGPYPYGGYGMGYGGYGGTYEGSVLNGLGAYARGLGEYNYYSALAAREGEVAREQLLKNHKLAVENWVGLRKARQERRKAHWEKEKLTAEQVARLVESNRPDRLTAAQYEPATGKLNWPAALLSEPFAKEREALAAAFAKRTAKDAGADSEFYDQVRRLTGQMIARLSDQSGELAPMQVIAAKKFLVGLKYESLSPSDVKALAISE